MIVFNKIEYLMSKNNELNHQIEILEKERDTLTTRTYIDRSKELYFKILELTNNEYELYQLIGSNAPIRAPLMLIKNFPSGSEHCLF